MNKIGVAVRLYTDAAVAVWIESAVLEMMRCLEVQPAANPCNYLVYFADWDPKKYKNRLFNPRPKSVPLNEKSLNVATVSFVRKLYGTFAIIDPSAMVSGAPTIVAGCTAIPRDAVAPGGYGAELSMNLLGARNEDEVTRSRHSFANLAQLSEAYHAYSRAYPYYDMNLAGDAWNRTVYEQRANTSVSIARLRQGIRDVFWDNILSTAHLQQIDVRSAFASCVSVVSLWSNAHGMRTCGG